MARVSVPCIKIYGQVESVTYNIPEDDGAHMLLQFFDDNRVVRIPGIRSIEIATHIASICSAQPDRYGHFLALEAVALPNERLISDDQVLEQLERIGAIRFYKSPVDFTSSPVVSKITEIETQLVSYLARNPGLMKEMNSDAFEKLVAELLASQGFCVEWTGRNKNTAADVIAFRWAAPGLPMNYIVECKRYSDANPVGIEIARALYGAKADEQFASALLVTTSTFQKGVEEFAVRRWDFALRDFQGLVDWLNVYRPRNDGQLHMAQNKLVLDDWKPNTGKSSDAR